MHALKLDQRSTADASKPMRADSKTEPGRRRWSGRLGATVMGIIVSVSVLAGCAPDPVVESITVPDGTWIQPLAMNAHGLAVGAAVPPDGNGIGHAASFAVATGVVTRLPDPPAGVFGGLSGTFDRAVDVNDQGIVVGTATDHGGYAEFPHPVVYDMANDTWQFPSCPEFPGATRGVISNTGLVACGTQVYDVTDQTYTDVAMPPNCDGQVAKVNAHGVAVGRCSTGDDPLFAADIATGVTVGFADSLGVAPSDLTGVEWEGAIGNFTDSGYLVVDLGVIDPDGPSVRLFTIPANLAQQMPGTVDLGLLADMKTVGFAISEAGVLAVNAQANGTWILASYAVAGDRIRAFDTVGLSGGAHTEATFTTGYDDAGRLIGFQTDPASDVAYQGFATTPTG